MDELQEVAQDLGIERVHIVDLVRREVPGLWLRARAGHEVVEPRAGERAHGEGRGLRREIQAPGAAVGIFLEDLAVARAARPAVFVVEPEAQPEFFRMQDAGVDLGEVGRAHVGRVARVEARVKHDPVQAGLAKVRELPLQAGLVEITVDGPERVVTRGEVGGFFQASAQARTAGAGEGMGKAPVRR